MKRAVVLTLLLSGCFNFTADLANCRDAGACLPLAPDITRGSLCSVDGWCWATPTPHVALNAVVSEDSTAWAFGDRYTLRFDGTQWIPVAGPSGMVRAAVAFGPADIFVVGQGGLQHWDGAQWSPTGVRGDFRAVGGTSGTDLWLAPILGGDLIHWSGGSQESITPPVANAVVLAFAAVSPSSVWAVGESGLVLHWDGTAWMPDAVGLSTSELLSVWADGQDVWVGGAQNTLLHRVNGSWQSPASTVFSLNGIAGTANDLWFAGYGGGWMHWANGAMTSGTLSGVGFVYALGSGPAGLFAVGAGGIIQQRVGGAWRSPSNFGAIDNLSGVHGTAADDVWVVGQSGRTAHFDGQSWTYDALGGTNNTHLSAVFASSRDVVWVADQSGQLIRRAGGTWSSVANIDNTTFYGVWASSETDAWAVGGENGDSALLHKTQGGSTPYAMPGGGTLRAVAGLSATDVWAVGDRGVILHWDGSTWSPEVSGTTSNLLTIAISAGEIYAAGGTVLHREGGAWRSLGPATGEQDVNSIASDGAGGVWFASHNGVVGKLDLQGVSAEVSGFEDALNGIWSPSPGVAFAVGDYGAILQH